MKTVNLIQGSPEWHAHRAQHFNASDAPAMMGCSPYKTREELIAELATGVTPEVKPAQQRIFDAGHQFEALARPLAEEIVGEELYPVVGAEGRYSASFDGLTMLEDTAFEHKSLNAALREAMVDGCTGADLPLVYQVQMEQQAMVSGCTRILFMASKWEADRETGEWVLVEERHCWYTPNLELRTHIVAGWEQLEREITGYVVPAAAPMKVVAEEVTTLPVVFCRVSGDLEVKHSLPAFEAAWGEFLANKLMREPESDQDFATLEQQVKAMEAAEAQLDAAEESALSETEVLSKFIVLKRALLDMVCEQRKASKRQLTTKKESIKLAQVQRGQKAFAEHIAALNTRLGKPYMPAVPADFPGAIKGKRTVDSLRGAVNDELARAKIAANEVADRIQVNLTTLRELASQHAFLFADTAQIVLKAADDCTTLVKARIAEHQAAEAKRLEAEREKIRAEESAKLQLEAEAKARAEAGEKAKAEAAAVAAAAAESELERQRIQLQAQQDQVEIAQAQKAGTLAAPVAADLTGLVADQAAESLAGVDAQQAISAAKNRASVAEPVEVEPGATVTMGQINNLIAPYFSTNAAGLAALGFEATTIKAAKHFPASDVPKILAAMVKHLQGLLVAA